MVDVAMNHIMPHIFYEAYGKMDRSNLMVRLGTLLI